MDECNITTRNLKKGKANLIKKRISKKPEVQQKSVVKTSFGKDQLNISSFVFDVSVYLGTN